MQSNHIFKKWTDLSDYDKLKNKQLTDLAFSWCRKNPNIKLTYKSMNNIGLEHLYSFYIKNFNNLSVGKIIYDDTGIEYIPGNFNDKRPK